jgi:hypothetical protein
LPVNEPLAFRAVDRAKGSFGFVETKLLAGVIAEVVLRKVALQVLLVAMLVDALHPALEHGEHPPTMLL